MKIPGLLLVGGLVSLSLPCSAQAPFSKRLGDYPQRLAPYVPSPQAIVDKMLEMAELKPGELLYDLGCGDGRIPITAAQRYRARGICVEIAEALVRSAEQQVRRANLQDLVKVIHADIMEVDLNSADVVTIYLETSSNDKLKPVFERKLKPGARVVSHDFAVRGWTPIRTEKLESYNRSHIIYVYEMPGRK
ncbi:MAG TPA: class I SAM-dependent methyltransferase [Bryobacteraceae bacterium]|jgi:predicted RNA methylase|nr:class I SAM-dependent methyltransferase [Bryobacteraceae bacterium]